MDVGYVECSEWDAMCFSCSFSPSFYFMSSASIVICKQEAPLRKQIVGVESVGVYIDSTSEEIQKSIRSF